MNALGPTGNFPRGKIHPSDEGELKFGVITDKTRKVIVFDFGQSVKWFALPKEDAIKLANTILERANELP